LEEADCGGGGMGADEGDGGAGAPEAEPCGASALPTSGLPTEEVERWQFRAVVGLSATPGLLGGVSVLWAVVFCCLLLMFLKHYQGANDNFIRINTKLDLPIKDFRRLAIFLATKKLITSRVEEVSGRDVKLVEWQEHDRHGEETGGRWGEAKKRLKKCPEIVMDVIGVDGRCRRRNMGAVAPMPEPTPAGGAEGGMGVGILMMVKKASKTLVRAGKRRIGWAGLPPKIELIIDLESRQIRSAVFTVDISLRPDLSEIEMSPMLSRLLIQHLELAESVAEGTAIKLFPRPTTPGGTLMEGRG
jgi:hypothetical protein